MTGADLYAVLAQLVTLAVAGLAAYRAHRAKSEAQDAVTAIHRLEIAVNGRLHQLLELTGAVAHAKGVSDEQHNPQHHPEHRPPPADQQE